MPGAGRPAGGGRPAPAGARAPTSSARTPRAARSSSGACWWASGTGDIAVLSGPATVPTAVDRVAGFSRALVDEAGLPAAARAARGVHDRERARHGAGRDARVPRPTALFAANNFIAIGVLHALDELGLRVPDDVAVVGFDDLPEAMVTFPFLTVVAQPAFEMGRRGGATLLVNGSQRPDGPAQEVVLPTEPGRPPARAAGPSLPPPPPSVALRGGLPARASTLCPGVGRAVTGRRREPVAAGVSSRAGGEPGRRRRRRRAQTHRRRSARRTRGRRRAADDDLRPAGRTP